MRTIRPVTDPRVRELADLLVDRCLGVQPGWQVSVRATPLARPLVEEVARAIGRRGAYYLPRINWGPDRIRADLDWALEAPLDLLGELAPIERYQVENEDARLTIRAPEDVLAGSELDPARLKALQQAAQVASRRARSLDVRWAVVEYPTEAAAAHAGMTLDDYAEFVFDACLLDWDAEEDRMLGIKERFDRARTVRITGAGTDLTLGIDGREGVVSAGFRNIPDGEVFYSPVEDTAEGVVHFAEFPAVYLGHDVVGARLAFEAGEVVEATADEGEEFLRQVLATDAGAKRLGELGLGCNPRITRFTRNVLFDEKIDGTVHLAVGASYTHNGGKNESAIHWDLVKDLRPGGELWADGELVQRDGGWLI
ncbi:MAG: aminopeptidase [Actinobacteria bacterium]|nr:aminopeptidase [Actinomycetota bacterium]